MTNVLFPGRPNYEGPISGWFGLLHHEVLVELSHDVRERITYVRENKPANEVTVRLHNMIYLGGCPAVLELATLYADFRAKRAPLYEVEWDALYAEYKKKRALLLAEYEAKRDSFVGLITAYIRKLIPDCAWNGTTLVFN